MGLGLCGSRSGFSQVYPGFDLDPCSALILIALFNIAHRLHVELVEHALGDEVEDMEEAPRAAEVAIEGVQQHTELFGHRVIAHHVVGRNTQDLLLPVSDDYKATMFSY